MPKFPEFPPYFEEWRPGRPFEELPLPKWARGANAREEFKDIDEDFKEIRETLSNLIGNMMKAIRLRHLFPEKMAIMDGTIREIEEKLDEFASYLNQIEEEIH